MNFPYGICDFRYINRNDYFYCDRTGKIPLLERSKFQLFIRPRRFGKSLLLSMLENYYDVAKKDEFDTLFGHLEIGNNPTPLRNAYFILRFDFSCVDPTGKAEDIRRSLYDHVNACIEGFQMLYNFKGFNLPHIPIDRDNALYSLKALANAVQMMPYPVYLLIDEYDNFANTVMMGVQGPEGRYEALVHEEGPLRTLFKAIKSATSGSVFDRVFITGVSPVVMSDITSGYNIAKNIYFDPELNDLCGFTEEELEAVVGKIVDECGYDAEKTGEALDLMRTYYNGYRFSPLAREPIYNPTLGLYFLEQFEKSCEYPRKMLDSNLATDDAKLEYISRLPEGEQLLMDLVQEGKGVEIGDMEDRFGIREMVNDSSQDHAFLISFLYYFGVLTIKGETPDLKLVLKVPNLVIRGLYVERIGQMLLPDPRNRDEGKLAAEKVYQKGDMAPLCRFVEERYFKVFHNRDYRWANELTVKTAFLTLLYNDIIYIMDSEHEIDRGHADLTMIIRPDKRHGKVFDVLIEFKFVTLKEAGLDGEKARSLSETALRKLPQMQKALGSGREQALSYGDRLEKKYGNLRLKRFVVVTLGFERICFEAVGN